MAHEAGKGDAQRPTDHTKFAENFDRIFGKRPTPQQERDATDAVKRQLADAINLASDPSFFKERTNGSK